MFPIQMTTLDGNLEFGVDNRSVSNLLQKFGADFFVMVTQGKDNAITKFWEVRVLYTVGKGPFSRPVK